MQIVTDLVVSRFKRTIETEHCKCSMWQLEPYTTHKKELNTEKCW